MPSQDFLSDDIRPVPGGNGLEAGQGAHHRMSDWYDEAAPTVSRLAHRAGDAARHGADWLRDGSVRVRHGVADASDRTVDYVRHQPVRSVLIVASAAFLFYAALKVLSGRDSR